MNHTQFISLASINKNFQNITFKSIINLIKDTQKFSEFTTNNTLISSMYLYSSINKIKEFSYYWVNPIKDNKEITKKNSKKYESNNNSGILGIGYDLENKFDKKSMIKYNIYFVAYFLL